MSATDFPKITDGRRALRAATLKCYNLLVSSSPRQYHYISDDIKSSALKIDHILEGDGTQLGSYRKKSVTSGTIALQLDKADDPTPDVGHVVSLTKRVSGVDVESFYAVDEPTFPNARNDVVRGSLAVTRIINPVLTGLLSSDLGDAKQQTYSIAAMGTTETIASSGKNFRTGSTRAYSATQADGSALPTGVAIDSTTGVITTTKATVVAGVYEIIVKVTDTITTLPANHPLATLEAEATLYLTVTA